MTKHDNVSQGKIMKATEFVKKFGWDEAKGLIAKHEKCYMPDVFDMWSDELQDFVLCTKYASFDMSDLKSLVESHELVESIGGLPAAKAHLTSLAERCANGGLESVRGQYKILRKAIKDVEACQ
ncbi:hypothetical protein [Acinetobacter radioresistens]|uniref:hypothetical protein n=1 Tax=Acinetobacter radioresistens TaxID=40216 RepID=UPI00124FFD12|nr:hypothetical protein [Acinetobacter radioresistens]